MKNHWNKKVILKYKNCGSNWAVYIEGATIEDVEQEFWGFWNWGATNGEFEWITEPEEALQSAYFWPTKARLHSTLINRCMTHLLNTTLAQEFNLDIVFGYEDDVIIAGFHQNVARALTMVQEKATDIGLQLNLSKCELIPINIQNHDCSLFPDQLKILSDGNFEYLGAPIGNQEFCNDYTLSKGNKLKPLFNAISNLEDPKISYILLNNWEGYYLG